MKIKATISFLIIMMLFLVVGFAFANTATAQIVSEVSDAAIGQLDAGSTSAGFGEKQDPRVVIINMVKGVLGLLGIAFTTLVVIGGYLYLTSHGMEEKVQKGKNTIITAVIGIIIVLMSYGIVRFISLRILEATGYVR